MNNVLTHISTIVVLLLWSVPGWAQTDSLKSKLTFGLNLKTHGEARSGGLPRDFGSEEPPSRKGVSYVMGRTRITADYKSSVVDAKVTAQNQACWGAKDNDKLTLYEAWARIKAPFGLFGQMGRMELSYDDERILGPNDFAMAKLCHDVLRLGYEGHGHKAHAILAYNQNDDNKLKGTFYVDGAQPYKTMQTLWYHYDLPALPIGASVLFMNTGIQAGASEEDASVEYQQMIGGYLTYSPEFMKVEASYYRQLGHDPYDCEIDAWMMSGKLTLKPSTSYGIVMGYDYLSGDDYVPIIAPGAVGMPDHKVIKGFSSIYGSNHKFFGVMDYFYESAYSQGFTPGLQNAYIGGYINPTATLSLKVSYHYLLTATKIQNCSKKLGHNVNLGASFRFSDYISLLAGFSYMAGTETMDKLKQGENNKNVFWGWFSLVVTPRLFTVKW